MSRLHPIPYGAGVLLVPDYCAPHVPVHDDRIVRPTRAAGGSGMPSFPTERARLRVRNPSGDV